PAMTDPNNTFELPDRDKLITRPDEGGLPTAQDLKSPLKHPTDPKPVPAGGQGTDPEAGELGHSA
ncbi:MAG TPA: hypothetical protein VKE40_23460, partial [Gemmataceae bacterium]|nr:hypothetical protein [Gemmataceae bacterium]